MAAVQGVVVNYEEVRNIPAMFFGQADKLTAGPLLWCKASGDWASLSWNDVADEVERVASGLIALGIEAGDRVAIVSENRPEWFIADIAIMAIGAILVPVYTTNTVDDHLHILENAGVKLAFVSTARLAERLIPAAQKSPACKTVVSVEPVESADGVSVHGWQDLPQSEIDVRARAESLDGDEVCCFIYTSGTGGRPKGVMLTHRSILANCRGAHDLLETLGLGDDVFLSLLPLSHSYEHTAGMIFPISIGAQIYYSEGPEAVARNLAEARPTLMTAVPRLYEVLHSRISRGVEQQGGLKAKLFHRAVAIGTKRYHGLEPLTFGERLLDPVLEKLVRAKVATRFGGRLKAFVSGGAALNPDIGTFFLALGVRLVQGYGQTEASPVISANVPLNIRIETVGPPLTDVEVKIADDGEILVRGPLLMKGYWQDEEATAATIVDGWLHTGDIGEIDEAGRLKITDRKKDIIVNSGGDNISPVRIEGVLTFEQEIAQAMAWGDKRPWLSAVIVPDAEFVKSWASENGKPNDLATLADDKDFRAAMGQVVDRVNQSLSQIEKIRRFVIASEAFTTDNAQMTPTLKVRRHIVGEAYRAQLEGLY